MEMWKDVVGFEGRYEVSDHGRVRHLPHIDRLGRRWRFRILAQSKPCPYPSVPLGKGKIGQVHRLVAAAFLGPANGRWVLHANDDPTDNTIGNLRYGTPAENSCDWSRRQTPYDRIEDLYLAGFGSRRIALWLGCKRQTVANILQRMKAA
jgi:hypothetical protein